jgi:hypothetical protein
MMHSFLYRGLRNLAWRFPFDAAFESRIVT